MCLLLPIELAVHCLLIIMHYVYELYIFSEYLWTSSDKVREKALLQELQDIVNLRNNIVDSIEEDRIR